MSNQDYLFTFDNGNKIKRKDLELLIIDSIGEKSKDIKSISKELKINYQSISTIIRTFCNDEVLIGEKTQRHNIYRKSANQCMLQDIWKPKFKKVIEKSKKIKGRSYRCEDFKNINYFDYK